MNPFLLKTLQDCPDFAEKIARAKAKANAAVGQEDVPMKTRMREAAKIMNKAKSTKREDPNKSKKKKTMSRKARETSGKKGPALDRRMLADKRGEAKKNAKKGGKRGGRKR